MNPRIGLDRSQTRVFPRSGTAARSAPRAGGVASTQSMFVFSRSRAGDWSRVCAKRAT